MRYWLLSFWGGGGSCFVFGSSSVLPISPARTRLPRACSILPLLVLYKIPRLFSRASYNHPSTHHSASDHSCPGIILGSVLYSHLLGRYIGNVPSNGKAWESRKRAGVLAMGNPRQWLEEPEKEQSIAVALNIPTLSVLEPVEGHVISWSKFRTFFLILAALSLVLENRTVSCYFYLIQSFFKLSVLNELVSENQQTPVTFVKVFGYSWSQIIFLYCVPTLNTLRIFYF